jgi:hypothetical protein
MKPRAYIETTIVSYLTARTSRDLVRAGEQEITREWWDRRVTFDLYISQLVLEEAGGGDPDAARRRLVALQDLQVLRRLMRRLNSAASCWPLAASPRRPMRMLCTLPWPRYTACITC